MNKLQNKTPGKFRDIFLRTISGTNLKKNVIQMKKIDVIQKLS